MENQTNGSDYDKLLFCNDNNNTNISCMEVDADRRSKLESYTEAILLLILMIVANIGNITVLGLIVKVSSLRKPANILVANLALADISFVTLNVPFAVSVLITDTWVFSDAVCQLNGTLFFTSGIVSLLNLTAISVHRYFQICRPDICMKYFTYRFSAGK